MKLAMPAGLSSSGRTNACVRQGPAGSSLRAFRKAARSSGRSGRVRRQKPPEIVVGGRRDRSVKGVCVTLFVERNDADETSFRLGHLGKRPAAVAARGRQ